MTITCTLSKWPNHGDDPGSVRGPLLWRLREADPAADGDPGQHEPGRDIVPVENLAESLQVAFDAGAKRLLLPMASVKDIPTIPGELFAKFQTGFYADASDAVFKALGVG
jgi:hypothetical protein